MEFDRDTGQFYSIAGDTSTNAGVGVHVLPRVGRPGLRTRERLLAEGIDDGDGGIANVLVVQDADEAGVASVQGNEVLDVGWGYRRNRSSVWRRANDITNKLSELLERIPDSGFRA